VGQVCVENIPLDVSDDADAWVSRRYTRRDSVEEESERGQEESPGACLKFLRVHERKMPPAIDSLKTLICGLRISSSIETFLSRRHASRPQIAAISRVDAYFAKRRRE
jgi:hypothetical protein